MRRKFNFTGRGKIKVAGDNPQLAIELTPHSEGQSEFSVDFKIEEFTGLPETTRIVLEAWYRTSYSRYELGTIGAPSILQSYELHGIEAGSVRFNLKLVAEDGRILAMATGVHPTIQGGDGDDAKSSLIGVQSVDMNQMWRIRIEPDSRPVLEVNKEFNLKEKLRSDPMTKALVFPAMLREIAVRNIAAEMQNVENEWGPEFRVFAQDVLSDGTEFPREYDGLQQSDEHYWIERFVEAFCNKHDLLDFDSGEEI